MTKDPTPQKIPLIFYRSGINLPTKRAARVMLCLYCGHLVALHGFIKKTPATLDKDLALARKRQKEVMR
jgi:phage-related protein